MRFSDQQLTEIARLKGWRIEKHEIEHRRGFTLNLIGIEMAPHVWTWFRDLFGAYDFDHKYSQNTGKTSKGWNTAQWPTERRLCKELEKYGLTQYPD